MRSIHDGEDVWEYPTGVYTFAPLSFSSTRWIMLIVAKRMNIFAQHYTRDATLRNRTTGVGGHTRPNMRAVASYKKCAPEQGKEMKRKKKKTQSLVVLPK